MKLHEIKDPNARNLVAKHARNKAGAGRHEDKTGNKAKRSRQKTQWKREVRSTE